MQALLSLKWRCLQNKQNTLLFHPWIRIAEMIVTSFSLCAFPFRGRFTLCIVWKYPSLIQRKKSRVVCDKNSLFYNLFTKINFVSSWAKVICPHLYKGIQRVLAQPPKRTVYKLFTNPYHYICRFAGASLRMKLQLPHFIRDFAGVIERTKFSIPPFI